MYLISELRNQLNGLEHQFQFYGHNLLDLPADIDLWFSPAIFRTAKAVGLTMPTSILQHADEVIE